MRSSAFPSLLLRTCKTGTESSMPRKVIVSSSFVWHAAVLFALLAVGAGFAAADDGEGSFDKTLSVSGHVDLDVKTDSGGISVVPGSGGTIKVHAILKAQRDWFGTGAGNVMARIHELERNPPIEQMGNHIRVGYVSDRNLLRGISMRLEIQTPSDTEVQARADSGGIHVEGMRAVVNCRTDSGGIELHDIGAGVRAVADSGGIRIDHVDGSVFAKVDSGGITARGIAGAVEAEADSGGVHIAQTKAAPISAKTDSGGVTVSLAPGAGYDLKADSDSGSIHMPGASDNGDESRHHKEAKVHGGGPLVQVRVSSGTVEID